MINMGYLNIRFIKRVLKSLFFLSLYRKNAVVLWTPENIGDFLMTTPAIKAIVQYYSKDNNIYWCVAQSNVELAKSTDINAKIIPLSQSVLRVRPDFTPRDYLDYYFEELKQFGRDRVVIFFVFGASVNHRLLGLNIAKAVSSNEVIVRDINQIQERIPKIRNLNSIDTSHCTHWIDKHTELAESVGIDVNDRKLYVHLPAEFSKVAINLNIKKPYFVIHPGGYEYVNSRRWPQKYFIALSSKILSTYPHHHIYITGGKEDEDYCEEIVLEVDSDRIINFSGKLSILHSAELFKNAEFMITNDTGSLHIADAVGCQNIFAIFGPTDPSRIAPVNNRCIVMTVELECRPCVAESINSIETKCPYEKQWCLENIEPEQVLEKISNIVEKTVV